MSLLIDPSIDPSTIDTSYPTLAKGSVVCRIGKIEVKENSKQTGRNIIVPLKLDEEHHDTNGNVIKPGYMMRSYLPLQPGENAEDPQGYLKRIYRFLDAALGIDDPSSRPALDEATLESLEDVQIIVKVRPGENQDGESQTDVAGFATYQG